MTLSRKAQIALFILCGILLAVLPVFQGFDIAAAIQPLHADFTDIADGEVGVQGLAQYQRLIAEGAAAQFQVQLLIQADVQLQLGRVWPAGEWVLAAVEDKLQGYGAVVLVDAQHHNAHHVWLAAGNFWCR